MEHPQDTERLDYTSAAEQEKPKYTPRPRYQIVLAWILLIVVLFAVGGMCYWQITLKP